MIIDAHLHLWDRIDGRLGRQRVRPLKDGMIQVGNHRVQGMPSWFADCRNPAELALAALDDAGVDGAVVTQEYLDGNQNRYLSQVARKYPKRFFVHGLLDFRRPAGRRREFLRVLRLGFRGIKCPAMVLPGFSVGLDDPALMSVWEQMEERGMVLSIDLAPGDVQVAPLRTVAKRFPGLTIVIGHFGMVGQGKWMRQIELADAERVYIESGGIIWLFRHEGPPFPGAQKAIRQAMQAVGAGKLLWGSDYPRTMVDFTYRQSLELATQGCDFMTQQEKQAFLGRNAAKVYGFDYRPSNRRPHPRITEF
jgi:L-galactono-1,5-lactonase